ncbi:metalloprotease PmbA [Wenzhouxiangella sp. EGI_FJ10409]|uniref:metalloprotease PmbA n=1 Tax=Wenzhouxiangella sp. EGI_FJ10409 TaxID=3243767 RepID=UPI0035D64C01
MSRRELTDTDNAALLHDPDRETELLVGIAQHVLERARTGGAEQAEVSLGSSLGREASVRLGEVETLEEARDRSVQVTVYVRQCSGSASTGDLRPEAIDETVDRALAIARNTQPDRAAGLAEARLMANDFPDLELWHAKDIPLDEMVERARVIEQAGREADERIANSEGASVTSEANLAVYANSHGFVGRLRGTAYSQSCVLIARDESGMQRDYDFDAQRCWTDLAAPEITGSEAARRSVRRLGSKRIRTGRMPVLFVPEVARGLIGHLVAAVSGGNLYRRSSFLLDAVGERVLPEWASLVERPHLPRAARSASFDGDGVATRESPLVEAGVLSRYVLSSYSARRLGLETTANAGGVHNLELAGATHSFDELLAEMGEGLVVTELMGQGVNIVTGDYSRGAAGFRVEDGRIAAPVEEITIAGNLRDMLTGLVAAGTDMDPRHNIRTGSLLVGAMTVAGQEG